MSSRFRTLVAPDAIPTSIPPIDLNQTFDPREFTGVGTPVGPEGGPGEAADVTRVFVEAVVDEPPERVAFPPPEYPRMLLGARIEGTVILEAVIDTLGRPEPATIRVVSSTNHGFDAAARAALRGALFQPGRVHGQRVRVLVHQPLKFSLP